MVVGNDQLLSLFLILKSHKHILSITKKTSLLLRYIAPCLSKFCLYIACGIIVFHPIKSFSQNTNDSLRFNLHKLKTLKTDNLEKVKLLSAIGLDYKATNYQLAKKYLHAAEKLSAKIHDQEGHIEALNQLGHICKQLAEYDSAIYFHLKCKAIRESIGDNMGVVKSEGNLGLVYFELNDSAKAKYYLFKALEGDIKYNNSIDEAKNYNDIGNLYERWEKPDTALKYYFKALPIFQKLNNKVQLAIIFQNIGAAYYYKQDYKKALSYFIYVAGIRKQLNLQHALVDDYNNIGMAYKYINTDSALHYFSIALELAQKTAADVAKLEIYGNMASLYQDIHDYKKAFEYDELSIHLKDSIFTKAKNKAIAELQTKYETEEKEQKIESLTAKQQFQHRLRNSLIIIIAMVIIVFIVVYNRYRFGQKSIKIITREKKRSDELLLNILPEEVAEELKEKGSAEARLIDAVTVLFTDFKNFTTITEKLSPNELVAEINECFSAFDLIMEKYGIEKIKTIGDSYMAAGGLPSPNNTHPEDVLNAALAIQQFMHQHKINKEAQGKLYFETRIGIHTGPVVAGIVGVKKFQYDIWGDTVNTASRMESSGVPGKINISGTTYAIVKEKFTCVHRGKIAAKGKGEVDMYFVEGLI